MSMCNSAFDLLTLKPLRMSLLKCLEQPHKTTRCTYTFRSLRRMVRSERVESLKKLL